jgi:hypothetical protein
LLLQGAGSTGSRFLALRIGDGGKRVIEMRPRPSSIKQCVGWILGEFRSLDEESNFARRPTSQNRDMEYPATSAPALVLSVGWGRGRVVVMAVVEDFADAATRPLGDLACALCGTDADVLASDACAFANVACGVHGVEGDEIAGAFADALGCLSGSLGGALADVAGSAADVTAGAAGLGLRRGLRLGGGLGWGGGGLGVLGAKVLDADGESEC